jgi:hypothetical protein
VFVKTFDERSSSRHIRDLDGVSRMIALVRRYADSLSHQGTIFFFVLLLRSCSTTGRNAYTIVDVVWAGGAELCWTLANVVLHCDRDECAQPVLAADVALFEQLLQSSDTKVMTDPELPFLGHCINPNTHTHTRLQLATRFAALAILACVSTEVCDSRLLPELLECLRVVSHAGRPLSLMMILCAAALVLT